MFQPTHVQLNIDETTIVLGCPQRILNSSMNICLYILGLAKSSVIALNLAWFQDLKSIVTFIFDLWEE